VVRYRHHAGGRLRIQGAYNAVTESAILKEVKWKAWGKWEDQSSTPNQDGLEALR
jgi:hypothetical protein